ncbi:MAG: amino acid adenylation domain-containing protein, partial [Opitutales bacterium]|nr:amino acid adenylation domain-containing protein [Opitutales bacterium]
IEFLGRTDDQVKIRGFRVELGEIESSLVQHPFIRECAVSIYESSQGMKRLAAYYVKQENAIEFAESDLKSFLKDRLPEYMIPHTFVALEELPLSPNRKIDRKALPVPVVSKRISMPSHEKCSDLERALSEIWCNVLDLESVSLSDNFFDVGGHSLLATQVQIRISQYLDVDLTLKDLFENPSINELASLLSDQVNPTTINAVGLIEDQEVEDFEIPANWFPASSQQKRLWFVDHFQGQSPEYTFYQEFRISGELDTECLKKAYEQLFDRHASLRTQFESKGIQVYQVVEDTVECDFKVSNLRFRQGNVVGEELEKERNLPFRLSESPLIRARLFVTDENEHLFTLSVHHIVADRRSVDVILRDLETLYNASLKGETLQLISGQEAYSDYSVKQNADHLNKTFDESLNYWSEKLRQPEPLNIPTDFTRPQNISNSGAIHEFELDRKVVEELKDFSGVGNKSDHASFLAAFVVLLARYSRQKDVILGLPVSDRGEDSLEHVVGHFVNTPVVRVDLSDDPNFYSLLKRVSNEVAESTRHHTFPFEKIVELVNPPRDTSRHPIFQVTYSVEEKGNRVPQLDGVEIHGTLNETTVTHYDLCLELNLNGDSPRGLLRYNSALFKLETIERMGRHYDRVLKSLSQNSREAVTRVNYLTDREQEFILGYGMGPTRSIAADRCLHHLFEGQAARNPEKVAVRTGETILSYGSLNRRANHLASVLMNSDIKSGSIVGVYMESSAELLISLLAVLKIGCAYLPLNIRLPEERLTAVCKESGLKALLIHSGNKDRFEGISLKVLLVNEQEGESESYGPVPSIGQNDAAYAIYTSGSTGVPKGTVVNHGSVVNLIEHGISRPGITARDTFLSVASFSFDISVFEMFGPLSVGAELILPAEEERNDVTRLVALLERHSVTVMHGTPSLWKVMVASGWKGKSSIKILTGGENLTSELAQDLMDRSGALWNLYGPTETTIFSTANHVKSSDDVSLGYPITNTKLYVVDEYLNIVPEGVAGELLIGGRGVANGYCGDKSLSLGKFIPNPFSSTPGSMVFKTGDLCRWGSDGKLEYLERVDEQVKISGYRIELGDIEANLIKYSGIESCAVKAWLEKVRGHNLVGYVVKSNDQVSADDLLAYLSTQLPDYMVPSHIEFLDNLPATVRGKIDKRILICPSDNTGNASPKVTSALSQTEQAVATIWSDILEIDLPGLDEDFFDLGGHSLIAFQVINRLRNTLDVEISLRELFDHPTVAELSAYILAGKKSPTKVLVEELKEMPAEYLPKEVDEPAVVAEREAPLSFAQSRIWFLEQLEQDMVAYNMFSADMVEGSFDPEILRRCLETIVGRQSSYRTNFSVKEGHPVQVVNSATKFYLPIVDLTDLEEENQKAEVDSRVKKEASAPFNLESDLKIRSTVLKLADDKHVLMINQHHIATDGWSTDLLWKELSCLYEAYSNDQPSPLPDLESSYAQFSIDQRDQLQGKNWDRLLDYWKAELEGINPLELPTDRPRPNQLSSDGDYESLELDADLVKRLREFCISKGSTMHMMVMSTFQILLARLSGQSDVVVGLPSVTRNSPELEDIIGVFLSTLLVRGNLGDNPSFSDFLNQIRFKSLEALDH